MNQKKVLRQLHRVRLLMAAIGISLFIVGFGIVAISATNETNPGDSSRSFPQAFLLCGVIVSFAGVVTATAGPASFLLLSKKKRE